MANISLDPHNEVSSTILADIVETSATTLINSPELAKDLPALLIRGAAGIGKSTIVREVAEKLKIGFIDIRLPQLDRCDLLGVPSVENGMTKWNIPSMWPQDQNSAGILFLDELTSASPDVQVAAYSLILDRVLPNTGYKLPDKWLIVAAGNRATDHAVVRPMSSALANRFMHLTLTVDFEAWGEWAVANELHPSVTGFIKFKPQHLHCDDKTTQNLECGFPTPRSWEKVSTMLKIFGNNEAVLRKIVYGLVGPSVGIEFIEFHKLNQKMADVEEWLKNPNAKIELPKKADELYAVVAAVPYILWNAETDEELDTRISGFYRIINKLESAYAVCLAKSAMQGNKKISKMQAIMRIMKAKEYKAFAEKYAAAMNKKYEI